jgi:DNA processing protein
MTAIALPEHEQEQRVALAALTYAAEFPDRNLIGLLSTLSPANVAAVIKTGALPGGGELPETADGYLRAAADALPRWRDRLQQAPADGGIDAAARHGFRLVCPGEPGWPFALYELGPDRPCALWVKGADLPQPEGSVAVTGSRAASAYGAHVTGQIADGLAEDDVAVIAGGAFGIDAAAHQAVLAAGGVTVAVVPNGPGPAYPAAHVGLLEDVASGGGTVVTEQPPGRQASRLRLASRSRLIAALSCGTVLVEAPAGGSVLRVAHEARRLRKPVMAVPGPVTSGQSEGCNGLIRDGAALVTSAADVRAAITAYEDLKRDAPISGQFTALEVECLVRTAGEAVHGNAIRDDGLHQRQIGLSRRAYDLLMAEFDDIDEG